MLSQEANGKDFYERGENDRTNNSWPSSFTTRHPPLHHITKPRHRASRRAVSSEDPRISQKVVPDIVEYYSNDNDLV
ncbi:hypothetical protein B296_00001671 [Ensete ventricosum]|uniref:Uncharacterized protein n=1 Tax=Ensete ventricosum TaxID=4639 RepID=A0A427ARN8_ENSVE|nr:hypothetical protein B296_00001671 [Ensete ventricosum]